MSKQDAEIKKAREIAAEMENSLSYFKTFIANMERFVTSVNVEQEKTPLPVEIGTDKQKKDMYSIKTLAAELGVSERTVRRYCNEGLIRYIHIRGKIRFPLKDVEEFYRDHYREKF
jgi:excisionase family DNA binding protein